jgi:putative transposase
MPRPHPPEFRQRAIELVRLRDKPVAQIARDLGISDSCLRNWVRQADVDDGHKPGLSSDERAELVGLRRKSRSAFHAWRHAQANPTQRILDDAELGDLVVKIHEQSFGTYGTRRVTAELRLGLGREVDHKRVERLMRERGLQGVTQHRTSEGWVYLAVVIDAWSSVSGWSIADHMRAELVADAIDMATWRRRPPEGAIAHSDHGSNYCSWVFGQRLRAAPVCSARWAPSATPSTTPSPSRSSRRCNANSSTGTPGPPEPGSPKRCSTGAKRSTTRPAATRRSATSARRLRSHHGGMITHPTRPESGGHSKHPRSPSSHASLARPRIPPVALHRRR